MDANTNSKPLNRDTLLDAIDNAHGKLLDLLGKNGIGEAKYLHTAATFLLAARAEAEKYPQ